MLKAILLTFVAALLAWFIIALVVMDVFLNSASDNTIAYIYNSLNFGTIAVYSTINFAILLILSTWLSTRFYRGR